MAQVLVPSAYFEKSKMEYQNWRFAWIREALQNAYDAGASEIKFSFEEEDDRFVATCIDNGSGMDNDTLINVLLCLGGSKKSDDSAVGKFGYAKTLLFFAHQSYIIVTRDQCVKGSGGEYKCDPLPSPVQGTQIHVTMKKESGDTVERWAKLLKEYVQFMTVKREVAIYLDKARLPMSSFEFNFANKTRLGPLVFKEVEGISTSWLVVSSRGLPMFIHYQFSGAAGFTGLLELDPGQELLTTNRDGLRSPHNSDLTSLVRILNENRTVLKTGRTVTVKMNATKPRAFSESGSEAPVSAIRLIMKEFQDQVELVINKKYPENFNIRVQDLVGGKVTTTKESLAKILANMKRVWVQDMAFKWKAAVLQFLQTPYAYSLGVRAFVNDGVVSAENHPAIEVADAPEFYLHNRRISAGFVIASSIEGQNVVLQKEILILINPKSLGNDYDLDDLFDIASHEIAHLAVADHNESFVRADIDFRRSWRKTFDAPFAEQIESEYTDIS